MKIDTDKIERFRVRQHLSRTDIARKMGISYAAYYAIVKRRKSTKLKTLNILAKVLKVKPFDLLKK